eukprot:1549829-Prymnesium_polylepis.2
MAKVAGRVPHHAPLGLGVKEVAKLHALERWADPVADVFFGVDAQVVVHFDDTWIETSDEAQKVLSQLNRDEAELCGVTIPYSEIARAHAGMPMRYIEDHMRSVSDVAKCYMLTDGSSAHGTVGAMLDSGEVQPFTPKPWASHYISLSLERSIDLIDIPTGA